MLLEDVQWVKSKSSDPREFIEEGQEGRANSYETTMNVVEPGHFGKRLSGGLAQDYERDTEES